MSNLEKYLSKAFVFANIYLLAIVLLGFFILPGIFDIDDYNFPVVLELFFKVTAVIAIIIIVASAIVIPVGKVRVKKSDGVKKGPVLLASSTFLAGLVLIFSHGLYVKLRSCMPDDAAWHCNVESRSYVGMLVLIFFASSAAGASAWLIQRLGKRR